MLSANLVPLVLAAVSASAGLMHLAGIGVVLARVARRDVLPADGAALPPMTLLRPVCGLENHIEETLETSFRLDYPCYELIFCAQHADDPIVPVVERLIAAYPQVDARLLIGDERICPNPKLNNLVKGWYAARFEHIVMSDSNVILPPDYFQQLLAVWDRQTGLVVSPPVGGAPGNLAGELECAFLNSFEARWQLFADEAGQGFAQGKTMLWRRATLDGAGGVAALASEPAEDAAATKVVRGLGRKVRLVRMPFVQPVGTRSLAAVLSRQERWAKLRRSSFPALFSTEILSGGFVPILAAFLAAALAGVSLGWPLLFLAAWYGAEVALIARAGWPLSWRTPALLLVRDLVFPAIWVRAWTGDAFVWRGNAMQATGEEVPVAAAPRPWIRRARAAVGRRLDGLTSFSKG